MLRVIEVENLSGTIDFQEMLWVNLHLLQLLLWVDKILARQSPSP